MFKKIFLLSFVLIALLGFSFTANAAKGEPVKDVGYVNVYLVSNNYPALLEAEKKIGAAEAQMKQEFNEQAKTLSGKELAAYARQLETRFSQLVAETMNPITAKLNQAVSETAKEKGLSVVVNDNMIIIGGIDITEDVIKKLQ